LSQDEKILCEAQGQRLGEMVKKLQGMWDSFFN
jgi:NAD(P)H dehydrogenase (quinone)